MLVATVLELAPVMPLSAATKPLIVSIEEYAGNIHQVLIGTIWQWYGSGSRAVCRHVAQRLSPGFFVSGRAGTD